MKKTLALLFSLIFTLSVFTGCGSSSGLTNGFAVDNNKSYDSSAPEYGWTDDWIPEEAPVEDVAYDMPMTEPMEPSAVPKAPSASGGNADADSIEQSQRKIIKNKTMNVETLEFDTLISELSTRITAYGGYIQNSTQNGNSYGRKGLRSASYTIRIPAQRFDEFTTELGTLATVTYTYEYIDDITAAYVDTEARLSALRAEQESFLKLMEKAETVEEILSIQNYLTNVNYQIESYTAQLNSYKSLVSYSTLKLEISEVERISTVPVAKPGVFERIKQGLSDNLYDIGEGFKDLFVGIVSALPYLLMLVVVILVAVLIVKRILRSNSKKQPADVPAAKPAEKKDDE